VTWELINAVKRIVGAMLAELPHPRRGILASVNPATMQGRVNLPSSTSPSGFSLTGWLPIVMPCSGPGWGIVASPPVGSQVVVTPADGNTNSAMITGAHWSGPQQAPVGYPLGEMWFFHATGAFVKINNSGGVVFQDKDGALVETDGTGKITMSDPSGSSLKFTNDGTVEVQANTFKVNGNQIMQTGSITMTSGIVLDTHIHTSLVGGGPTTGPEA
jgi:uncharacterized protein involved in type VI secretion and phage assembly